VLPSVVQTEVIERVRKRVLTQRNNSRWKNGSRRGW